ncbi:acetyltransferase [Paenibacillus sp. FSL H7-0357]|uniref:GNAT family N-acetyltransferase n=1 Tax=Paenibacillus sp. FSL H7-0357 TaxID=1536774 RepID=UPI0004F79A1D|nr:GNAT family protein [Paenibacillus sp. FSL H7-0357]AIQ15357.1 acetyltransferase [Paenibacillus sp. FSL H7-0357]
MSLKLYNTSQGIYLSLLQLQDADELLQLRLRNKVQHQPFEPLREDDYFTLESQKQLVGQRLEDARQDRAYMFGIFLLDGQLIGQVTISNVVRGVGQYADIGYFIDHEVQGKGYTSAAVGLILEYAFHALGLHRVQACILLHNEGSRRVLEKNGFQAEGIARHFIKINGQWQDHRTYAILADDTIRFSEKLKDNL